MQFNSSQKKKKLKAIFKKQLCVVARSKQMEIINLSEKMIENNRSYYM